MLDPTKDTPYLALTGELWGVFCEYLWENWSRYNSTTVYSQGESLAPLWGGKCSALLAPADLWPIITIPSIPNVGWRQHQHANHAQTEWGLNHIVGRNENISEILLAFDEINFLWIRTQIFVPMLSRIPCKHKA